MIGCLCCKEDGNNCCVLNINTERDFDGEMDTPHNS